MKPKCTQCNKEFEATRADAKYCSIKCRVAYNRLNVTDKPEEALSVTKDELSVTNVTDKPNVTDNNVTDKLSVTSPQTDVKKMSRDELRMHIKAYKGSKWVNSPEHNELMKRLRTWTIEKLEKLHYWIPNWKRTEKKTE